MSEPRHAGEIARAVDRRAYVAAAVLPVLMCAAFAAATSGGLAVYFTLTGAVDEPGLAMRLGVKALLFVVPVIALVIVLKRIAVASEPMRSNRAPKHSWIGPAVLLLIAGLLVFPRLGAYPWAGPDEVHHLIVARNLAEHGAYASGHPDTELIYFDRYDSIGPTLIAPMAAAFKLFGMDYAVARAVVGMFFVLLCACVFAFVRPMYGANVAALSVVLLVAAFASIYLARSVYGEVPALAFFVSALLAWRRSFAGGAAFAVAAGALFALATLVKTFMMLSLFAFAAALFYDRLTVRAMQPRHVLLPAAGFVAVYALWTLAQLPFAHLRVDDAPLVVYYRHYLMFGLTSAWTAASWFADHPVTALLLAAAFATALPAALISRYDPASIVLILTAILFAFWWCFFTPANTPRYLWYTCAIGAIFAAPVVLDAMKRGGHSSTPPARRLAYATALVVLGVSCATRAAYEIRGIYTTDVMQPEREVAALVADAPPGARMATTDWPLERAMNFLANRPIALVESTDCADYDMLIVKTRIDEHAIDPGANVRHIGHYTVILGDT